MEHVSLAHPFETADYFNRWRSLILWRNGCLRTFLLSYRLLHWLFILHFGHRGVSPKALHIIEFSRFFLKNMNNKIDEINYYPLEAVPAFAAPCGNAFRITHLADDIFGDRFDLPVARTSRNDEVIGHRSNSGEIEHMNVRGLFFKGIMRGFHRGLTNFAFGRSGYFARPLGEGSFRGFFYWRLF